MNKEIKYNVSKNIYKMDIESEYISITIDKKEEQNICKELYEHYLLHELVMKMFNDKKTIQIYHLPHKFTYEFPQLFIGMEPKNDKTYNSLSDIKLFRGNHAYMNDINIFINHQKTLCYFQFSEKIRTFFVTNDKFGEFYLYNYFQEIFDDIKLYNKMEK